MKPHQSRVSASVSQSGFFCFVQTPLVMAVLLAVVTALIYWPTTRNDFINLDDQVYVTECPEVLGGLTAENIRWAFQTTAGGNWHPLTWLSLMLDAEWSGREPLGYHLTNFLLHVANTLLLFGWFRCVTGALWRSAFVAALFALHPLHVESVAWVAERKDVLSTLFGLAALWAYSIYAIGRDKAKTNKATSYAATWYGVTLLCFVFSLMSKPMFVTLPFVCLLLDFWPLKRIASWRWTELRAVWNEKVPLLLLSVAASGVAIWAQKTSEAVASLAWLSVWDRFANAIISCVRYLGKTFWPVDLAVFYPHPGTWPILFTLGAGLILAVITFFVVRLRRCQPFLLVGWLWFLGTLIPVLGLVQVGAQAMADRYTYVPHIGLFAGLVWSIPLAWKKGNETTHRVGVGLSCCVILVGLAALTRWQIGHWQNSEQLFRQALSVTRNNVFAHVNLAAALLDQQRFVEAENECRRALAIAPDSAEALGNLGLALAGQQRWTEAIPIYEEALRLHPENDRALNGWGLALANQGQLAEATEMFRRALRVRSNAPEILNNLGLALALQGQTAEAKKLYQQSLKVNPREVQTLNNLGLLFAQEKNWTEAEACYRRALEAAPTSIETLVNWGAALSNQGKWEEAAQRYSTAQQIAPDNVAVLYNLGVLRVRQGKQSEAIELLTRVQQLQPGQSGVAELLNKLRQSATP